MNRASAAERSLLVHSLKTFSAFTRYFRFNATGSRPQYSFTVTTLTLRKMVPRLCIALTMALTVSALALSCPRAMRPELETTPTRHQLLPRQSREVTCTAFINPALTIVHLYLPSLGDACIDDLPECMRGSCRAEIDGAVVRSYSSASQGGDCELTLSIAGVYPTPEAIDRATLGMLRVVASGKGIQLPPYCVCFLTQFRLFAEMHQNLY